MFASNKRGKKGDRNNLILSTFIFLESAGCKVPTWYTTRKRDAFGVAAMSDAEIAEENFERHWDRNEASILRDDRCFKSSFATTELGGRALSFNTICNESKRDSIKAKTVVFFGSVTLRQASFCVENDVLESAVNVHRVRFTLLNRRSLRLVRKSVRKYFLCLHEI
jgi:hypothetical protein